MNIGFIGFGKMAQAIASGLSENLDFALYFYDINPQIQYSHLPNPKNIKALSSIQELEEICQTILFSVKPKDLEEVTKKIKGEHNKFYISIAAGISTKAIQNWNPNLIHLSRVMPNLGAFVKQSVSGIYSKSKECLEITKEIFSKIGIIIEIPKEELMHSITAISGSGPAYVFLFFQALLEAGIREGFSYDTSYELALYTIMGAIEILKQHKKVPTEWIYQVTSPAGTTIEALTTLEKHKFKYALYDAIHKAAKKSRELGT